MVPIPTLRPWLLQPFPSIYELQSATNTEMVAKLHGAMNNLITNYNKFVEDISTELETFSGSTSTEIQIFTQSVEKRINDQFNELNAQFLKLQADLREYAAQYLESVQGVLPPATTADNGKILQVLKGEWTLATPAFKYDPETESLNLIIGEET